MFPASRRVEGVQAEMGWDELGRVEDVCLRLCVGVGSVDDDGYCAAWVTGVVVDAVRCGVRRKEREGRNEAVSE
jgi:hypothetical protein